MKYTLSEIAEICGGQLLGHDAGVEGVFTDSRSWRTSGSAMFVAIRGLQHDGHSYIPALYKRGERLFLISEDLDLMAMPLASFVRVKDTLAALQRLAAHHRKRFTGTVVGVTGSNGKTVVKEWIAQLCPPGVKLFRSPKSYNSQLGVALSVLMIEGDEQIAVIEAGISQAGEMARLEEIVRPDVGVLTNIGDAHSENFRGNAHKLDEKLKLFSRSETIIYNGADSQIEIQLKKLYGERQLADASTQREVYARMGDKASRENASLAVTLFDILGYDHSKTISRLSRLQPVAMRLELREGINGSVIVNDSYNSDINSLAIALDYLNSVAGVRAQTLVLSDILQSGMADRELYARIASMVASSQVDHLIAIGEKIGAHSAAFAGMKADFYPSTDSALAAFGRNAVADRAILIKGNRASQFERLSHALQLRSHTTTLEVDLDAMTHNLNTFRGLLSRGTMLMAMVKASGYGNGDYEVASLLQHHGVDYLAVAFADEGVTLRRQGITMPIVVLNADEDSFELMVTHRLEPEIYNFASLEWFTSVLSRHSERDYPIHIKLDTGMHRLGFVCGDIEELNDRLAASRELVRVSTVFSHLASSDNPAHEDFTLGQIELFERMSSCITERLRYSVVRHIANSAAIERFPQAQFEMCRLGIGLYGIGVTEESKLRYVSTLKTRIVQIKTLPAGDSVGYGRAAMLTSETRTATIPVGYADGLNRHLGEGRWSVLVGGKPAPVVGRVCMDSCMVEITGIDAAEGDEVVIFGSAAGNTVEDMARVLGTIPYEIMTGISARVKRIYIKE